MANGSRQSLAYGVCSNGVEKVFSCDQKFLVNRIRLFPAGAFAATDTLKMVAEGENLWSGASAKIAAIGECTDHGTTGASRLSGWCIKFDRPLQWDPTFPLRLTVGGQNYDAVIEGEPFPV